MKIMTILGTRPEIIRLSLIIKKLDQLTNQHVLVHTGQNFSRSLSDTFFEQLEIRKPDYILYDQQQTLGKQLSIMFSEFETIIDYEKPDKVLVLGDTNSGLSAVLTERMGIPVVHMEAGNRCFDWDVPEEKNRKVIDAVSTFNMPYTPQSKENLLREGIAINRIYVSGNPIYEVLQCYKEKINKSSILKSFGLQAKEYFLVSAHRAENVDIKENLLIILESLNKVAKIHQKKVLFSVHPRTKSKIEKFAVKNLHPLIELHEPFSFFDFVQLEKHALCVLTDSGTVQEECCLFHVPTVTIRKTTERPETVECGSNIVSGLNVENILQSVHVMINQKATWSFPEGYTDNDVSDKVVKFLLGGIKRV